MISPRERPKQLKKCLGRGRLPYHSHLQLLSTFGALEMKTAGAPFLGGVVGTDKDDVLITMGTQIYKGSISD